MPGRAEREVAERAARHFDVGAEDRSHRVRRAEGAERAQGRFKGREVADIEPARIDRVSGQQHCRAGS